jgi:APA family basic amino acid/polyamine antiporter
MALVDGEQPGAADSPTAALAGQGLFARNATGLVREVSGKQQIFWNFLSGFPPLGLAIGVFFALGGFPGGNLLVAALLAIPLAMAFAYTYGLLTTSMPRTGGDYVFVSRTLHPLIGLISSCSFGLAGFTTIAFGSLGFSTLSLSPALSTIGAVAGSHTLVTWGATLASNKDWQFGIGVPIIILGCATCLGGWRLCRRVIFGLMWLALAGLGVTILIGLFTPTSTFASHFNAFASARGVPHAYNTVIANARKSGTVIGAGFSWAKTIPMVGVFASFGLYSWFSSFIGGEIRQASSMKTAHRNGLGALLAMGSIALCVAVMFHSFGQSFLSAVFTSGALPSRLGSNPAYFYLTSVQLNSTVVAVILSALFLGTFFIQNPYQVLFITRYLFAWAFDGLLPEKATHLNSRGAPDVAIGITTVLAIAVFAWAIFIAKNFVQVLVYNTLFTFISMGLVAITAVVLPYRRPALYQASASRRTIAGVPLLVWCGVASLLALGFIIYLYFHFAYFGLADKAGLIPWLVGIAVVAALLYQVPRVIRRREGVDLDLVYKEIPPE